MQFQHETYYSNSHISLGYEKADNFLAMQRRPIHLRSNLQIEYMFIFWKFWCLRENKDAIDYK